MSKFELNPGKYAPTSESGNFYFSCDTGTSVLVGTKQRYADNPNKIFSTCPILGISLIYNSTTPRFINATDTAKEGITSEYEHKHPEWLLRLGEMVVSPLPYRKPTDLRTRPCTPGLAGDGVGIGFILTCEWNWLYDRYSVDAGYNPQIPEERAEIFPGKPRAIDYDVDPEGFGPWICLLFTEVGLYELHCNIE